MIFTSLVLQVDHMLKLWKYMEGENATKDIMLNKEKRQNGELRFQTEGSWVSSERHSTQNFKKFKGSVSDNMVKFDSDPRHQLNCRHFPYPCLTTNKIILLPNPIKTQVVLDV